MKILFSYPPLDTAKGYPTLGQNRQFQYFSEPTLIYPVIPAVAATGLKKAGHQVIWNDSTAEGIGRKEYFDFVKTLRPDLIVFESKTPVIKEHWHLITEIKNLPPTADRSPRGTEGSARGLPLTVLVGDHVTALPKESLRNCPVDFVLTGGDYDFLLLNLCNNLDLTTPHSPIPNPQSLIPNPKSPIPNPQKLKPGIWYREGGEIKNTGPFKLDHDLNQAPFIDRELTKWELYAYKNGNYRRTPGTYIMSGRDCWWGRCSFCSWTQLYPRYRVRSPENVLDEIGDLLDTLPVREIMDDTGSFPRGEWLRDFCRGVIERGYHKKVGFDCNFRFGAASAEDYQLMKEAGFRFLLFGLESANQETLDRVNKGITVEEIVDSCRMARKAGLYPHITIMFGYPWEGYEEARKTLELGKFLLKKGYAYTMQATIVVPYPGTELYRQCRENDWLLTTDWSEFDMKQPIMKIPFPPEELLKLVQGMYGVAFNPEFLARKILSIRDWSDLAFFLRAGKKVLGHLKDFQGGS